MSLPLSQHQQEIQHNLQAWTYKPLLREIYSGFYGRILRLIDTSVPGRVVEVGSGIGNLKQSLPHAIATDLFPNPWLDLACDGYDLPFRPGVISHLVLFDVFHHLREPNAFLREARRVMHPEGRLILFEPYISWTSRLVYGLFHHEPVRWRDPIDLAPGSPRPRDYYAAQGNATRLVFRKEVPGWPSGWSVFHAEAFSCFHYLFSGGYSKPAFYPSGLLKSLQSLDRALSRWPALFGGRCLIGLKRLS